MMKTKLTLLITVLAAALFGWGCATTEPAFVKEGLVAYYPFNGNAKDESGRGNHGEVKGATLGTDRHDEKNRAYSFDGENDYIDFGKSESFNAYPLTLAVWIKCTNPDKHQCLLGKYVNASWNGWQLYIEKKRRIWPMYLSGPPLDPATGRVIGNHHPNYNEDKQFQTSSIASTSWFHVVLTIDDTGGKVFLDGGQEDNKKWSGTAGPPTTAAIFSAGDINPTTQPYEGLLDDIRIYNRALSAAEVKALYELEKPKTK